MSRGGFKITRCGEGSEEVKESTSVPNWMSEFASQAKHIVEKSDKQQKEAVTVVDRSRNNTPTIYEQMYAIMNGKKPLYSSVEEAVADYQKKTGLTDHLNNIQAESSVKAAARKILEASEDFPSEKKNSEEIEPIVFEKAPHLKKAIEKCVTENPGLSIPAILHIIAERMGSDVVSSSDLDDPNLSRYINKLLINNIGNIGRNTVGI